MSSPTRLIPVWATDPTFASGSENGSPVKVAPSAGQVAQGHVPGLPFAAGHYNDVLHLLTDWGRFMTEEALACFGDGNDGDFNVISPETALSEFCYDDVTVSDTFTLASNRLYVSGTLTVTATGIIQNSGANAVTTTGGAGAGSDALLGGGAGVGSGGVGPGNGVQATALTNRGGGTGGAGGAGGANAGGAAQTGTASGRNFRAFPNCVELFGLAGERIGGGVGGSSGGSNSSNATAGSGGGGGGVIVICARRVVLAVGAIIRANGGSGSAASGTSGNAGGGGGGGGGLIVILSRMLEDAGATIQVNGGTGGAAFGAGVAGSAGGTGVILLPRI